MFLTAIADILVAYSLISGSVESRSKSFSDASHGPTGGTALRPISVVRMLFSGSPINNCL